MSPEDNDDYVDVEIVDCPGCGAVAEILDSEFADSTSGPVEHIYIRCFTLRHHFFMPRDLFEWKPED